MDDASFGVGKRPAAAASAAGDGSGCPEPEPVQFSVVIPTYNRATSIGDAIRSVLAQDLGNVGDLEVIVADDGSTDGTDAAIAALGDRRVKYLALPHRGVCPARNAGAREARGEFLVFLDSDDELCADALARFAEFTPTHDVVVCGWYFVSPGGGERREILPDSEAVARTRFHAFQAGAFAIRRSAFDTAGGYDDELRYSENTELAWRVRQLLLRTDGSIGVVKAPLVVLHGRSQRSTDYDRARYDAAHRILERRSYEMEADPGDTTAIRGFRANYLAIAAVSASRLRKRSEALALAVRAVALQPASKGRYRTLASVLRNCLLLKKS
jgi:glycosyltransferase involved in cell wall biosynthesis